MIRRFVIWLAMLGMILSSCGKEDLFAPHKGQYEHVFIYYSLGFHNLSSDLRADFKELLESKAPGKYRDIAVVAYCHNTKNDLYNYSIPTSPVLIQLSYQDGETKIDTLKVYSKDTISASAEALEQALLDIRELFPSRRYGMLLSSHASGWLPSSYSDYGENHEEEEEIIVLKAQRRLYPLTKSIGMQATTDKDFQYKIDLHDFAAALPFKLEYLIFDACLMGCIEVAWELKDKCDYIIASPTETLQYGMVYSTLIRHLMIASEPNYFAICKSSFDFYDKQSGINRSATYSLYDCRKIEPVAVAFADILNSHRDQIRNISVSDVQAYFYNSKCLYFYHDLRDFAAVLGASESELAALDTALSQFIPLHLETPSFFGKKLERCCGISTYIPLNDHLLLNSLYLHLSWNKRVKLIQ